MLGAVTRVTRSGMRALTHAAGGLAALVCAVVLCGARADDADIGCGGFVRASGGLGRAKPDLSPVRAKLLAPDGSVRAETECAPNGYYYLPMYDTGAFVVRLEGPPVCADASAARASEQACVCALARARAGECACVRARRA